MHLKPHIKYLFVSVLLVVASACKKEFKTNTIVNFHLFNPVTQEGYAGVKVRIIEQEDVSGMLQVNNEYENTVIWEGITDASGKATFTFNAKKKDKYTYWQSVDASFVNNSAYELISQPEFQPIVKNAVANNNYEVVKTNNYVIWVKNTNCFDANDKFKWREKSLIRKNSSWSSWVPLFGSAIYPDGYFYGCFDTIITHAHAHTQDILDVEMEVTKNGFTTLLRDTFYITGQNGVDTLKLFY